MPRRTGLGDYLVGFVDDVGRTALDAVQTKVRDEAVIRSLRGGVALAKQLRWSLERLRQHFDEVVSEIYRGRSAR